MIFNPSKMCKGHKCLKMCNLDEVTEQFYLLLDLLSEHTQEVLDLLSEHTQEVRVVEPPPRCKHARVTQIAHFGKISKKKMDSEIW